MKANDRIFFIASLTSIAFIPTFFTLSFYRFTTISTFGYLQFKKVFHSSTDFKIQKFFWQI